MATHTINILGPATLPDTSGNVYAEPASVTQTNDRYGQLIPRFKDTATKIGLGGNFVVPENYSGTAKIRVIWTSTATSGNVVWDFDYTAIGGDDTESLDPSADQESATGTDAAPGASQRRLTFDISLTSANLAAGDLVQFTFSRDGASGSDTMTADAVVFALRFVYNDS